MPTKTNSNLSRRVALRPSWVPVLLSLVIGLSGCTSASIDTADQRHDDTLKRVGEARSVLMQPQASPAYAVEDQRPVIARRSIALSRDAALPDAFRLVTFRFPGRYTLPNVAERISREVGIPIVITSDALMPASMFSIASGGVGGVGAMGAAGMAQGAAGGLNGAANAPGATAGIVTLTDGAEAMAAVASYIDLINQSLMRQISLDIEVLEVDLNDDYAAGINWGMLQNGVQSGITQGNITVTAAPNLQANGTPFSIGYTGSDSRNVLLSVLRNFGRVSTAYSGVAVTSNRVSVPILVQNTQAYLMQTQSTLTATAVAGATATGPSLVPGQISTGLSVVLQPVILDSNQVLVQAFLNISSLKQLQSFSSAGQTIQLPNIDGFTVAQRLVVPSGKTMVMLGYDQASANNSENGPTDNVTTSKTVSNIRRSIVILITPRLTDV